MATQIIPMRRQDLIELVLSAVTLAAVAVLIVLVLTGNAFYFGLGLVSAFGLVVVDDVIGRSRYWGHVSQCAEWRAELVGEA